MTDRLYERPRAALAVAAGGLVVTALLIGALSSFVGLPGVIVDLAVTAVPLMATVVVGVIVGGGAFATALGLASWRWADALAGFGVALVVRAAVELTAPTTGAIGGFGGDATIVLALVSAAAVSPVVEEFFFRGFAQRAVGDAVGGARGQAIAVLVGVVAFVGLHWVAAGSLSVALLVATIGTGLGCGVLVAATGRLGGALVAHVVFNAIGVGLLVW
ncbi:CPBP family intramembrane glutamic endopeptidase [Microbacterium fluvii]|uniref:CPBP family intramembrane glutamic endopeptidase n=1 Tax=Microbacterium fluvii TaxID=415215 RepID=A0ABW2HCV6_9MICO|nr:CPBP family intramembrane glutamic endopeptidase [Microbacterium fluvii]MCU4671206.1 CPBP family intramembrane metalloprotease [Microbacterium fluvii]